MKAKIPLFFWLCLTLTFSFCTGASAESFLEKLLRITGVSATPSLQKGGQDDMLAGGQIWVANLQTGQARNLTRESGYRSPVFSPDSRSVLALKSNEIWRISVTGAAAEVVYQVPGLSKLVGISQDDTNQLCLLLEREGDVSVALLTLTSGRTMPLEYDKQDRKSRAMIINLKGWERQYGSIKVYPANQRKAGLSGPIQWNDIFAKVGDEDPVNVSKADGVNCGHPSLSPKGNEVVFIKETESVGR